jgi:hypothetical protein
MRTALDVLAEIEGQGPGGEGDLPPGRTFQVGMRKPTQRVLMEQIFGAPEDEEDQELMNMLRIRRVEQ